MAPFYECVVSSASELVSAAYGNYTVQTALEHADGAVRARIKAALRGQFAALSAQKFSSNVVEKLLVSSSDAWRSAILHELTAQPGVAGLLRDKFGNYVLQTGLRTANAAQLQDMTRAITPHLPSLRENVRAKWKKMLKVSHTER